MQNINLEFKTKFAFLKDSFEYYVICKGVFFIKLSQITSIIIFHDYTSRTNQKYIKKH